MIYILCCAAQATAFVQGVHKVVCSWLLMVHPAGLKTVQHEDPQSVVPHWLAAGNGAPTCWLLSGVLQEQDDSNTKHVIPMQEFLGDYMSTLFVIFTCLCSRKSAARSISRLCRSCLLLLFVCCCCCCCCRYPGFAGQGSGSPAKKKGKKAKADDHGPECF